MTLGNEREISQKTELAFHVITCQLSRWVWELLLLSFSCGTRSCCLKSLLFIYKVFVWGSLSLNLMDVPAIQVHRFFPSYSSVELLLRLKLWTIKNSANPSFIKHALIFPISSRIWRIKNAPRIGDPFIQPSEERQVGDVIGGLICVRMKEERMTGN